VWGNEEKKGETYRAPHARNGSRDLRSWVWSPAPRGWRQEGGQNKIIFRQIK
jgi:hypothetical protein